MFLLLYVHEQDDVTLLKYHITWQRLPVRVCSTFLYSEIVPPVSVDVECI